MSADGSSSTDTPTTGAAPGSEPPPGAENTPAREQTTGERIRRDAQRFLDEVEATPVVGDVYDWVRAITLGLKDTAAEMLAEGRKGARKAQDEAWRRFDDKTKYRRRKR